ncbi:MAG: hypothetical protein GY835_06780 [bacterium]|nr:hypothetical protein [bacterium]
MRLDLQVKLTTIDLVRATAWLSLTETLGWQGILEGLTRYDLWRFESPDADLAAFRAALDVELERTSSYYNPNKQAREFLTENTLGDGRRLALADTRPRPEQPEGDLWRALVWVTDEGGERPDLLRASGAQLRARGVNLTSVRTGTLWDIRLHAQDEAHARGFVAGLALSRDRRKGLLLNPHYQEGHLLKLEAVSRATMEA